jgi:hypothetical protein
VPGPQVHVPLAYAVSYWKPEISISSVTAPMFAGEMNDVIVAGAWIIEVTVVGELSVEM